MLQVVRERSTKIRDGLQMMGSSDASYYTSLMLFNMLYGVMICGLFTFATFTFTGGNDAITREGGLFKYSSPVLYFLMVWLYQQVTLVFILAFSTLGGTRKESQILAPALPWAISGMVGSALSVPYARLFGFFLPNVTMW